MPVVSAFIVTGTPLALLRPENPSWTPLVEGFKAAREALLASKPDVLLVYSTQWIAVLDQLWQTRAHVTGLHVDENWYEYGDLPFDMHIDTEMAEACVAATRAAGIHSKPVDYDAFPIDTGTIVADRFLNPDGKIKLVIGSNNVYHDFATTEKLAALAVAEGDKLGRRIAVVAVGGLSGSIFREEIDIATDRLRTPEDDAWNKKMLGVLETGTSDQVRALMGDYAKEARVDFGFKYMAWIFGALGGRLNGAKTLGYGPSYGSGAAVIQFNV